MQSYIYKMSVTAAVCHQMEDLIVHNTALLL